MADKKKRKRWFDKSTEETMSGSSSERIKKTSGYMSSDDRGKPTNWEDVLSAVKQIKRGPHHSS